ncbi:uncharacterized protein Z518_07522 [Rhinocladiella mackenziei CBS 650.93]|uniref:NAD(P)-binding protein n=1 Tax=Rhinocladiella mackenziei CBS 650.93 TaxID=1442369 RepID=A0A0D2IDT2_9EURO|nr:uncharacterized protein Z518_07522 [Rhinocladiella mackenziei CBS 650.93]KIX03969.1 hypothetical protein Z518_07522 [Rhinocladiella mackenziei CBS 650.93]
MATEAFSVSRDKLTGPKDSTILITGGSAGIGLQTAILLHDLGNNIIVVDRAQPHPSAPKSLISSPRFLYQQCDITSWKSQRGAFEAGIHKFGSIGAVFVNAGIAEYKDQFFKDELDEDGLLQEPDRRTVDIDMHAANDTAKLAIYYLKKKGGSIVMTASLAGYLASAGAPLYSAAKHGVVGLMRALKNDTAKLGIAISVVAPGITLTDIISGRKPGEPLQDWAKRMRGLGVPINDPQEIADCVVYLMSQGMEANGKGLLIQAGRVADLESGIARSRKIWMGEEMLRLFRGGRDAPLFPNRL